jgi:transposase
VLSESWLSYLLRKLGLSRQKPEEQATQRKEKAIKAWQDERWPALKKS